MKAKRQTTEGGHSCPPNGGLENPPSGGVSAPRRDEWEEVPFPDTLIRNRVGRENQILSSEIQPQGRFPVVDQGQAFVSGYCDEDERVIRDDLPLIIFGDHTRCFKYVDFPFILGADGTKVLKPDADQFEPRFYYYALLNLEIPSRGYNRHFKQLKERRIPRPEKDEQRKIAGVLGLVQRAMEQQERLIEKTAELKKTLLHQLFTHGLRGEPQKQTDIGPVPESWEVVRISDLFKFSSGKKRPGDTATEWSHSKPFPVYGGNGILGYSSEFLLDSQVMVLGRVGEYCGCAHHTEGKAWISDNALYPKKSSPKINTRWAAEYFAYANLNQYSNRAGQPLITQGVIGEVQMPLPPVAEQHGMETAFSKLNQKLALHRRKHATLTALFRTLLHQLMTAQIRVSDLDIDTSELKK